MSAIVATPCNMNCINDKLVTRYVLFELISFKLVVIKPLNQGPELIQNIQMNFWKTCNLKVG